MAIGLGDGRGRPSGPDSEVFDGTRQAVHAEEGVIGCITG